MSGSIYENDDIFGEEVDASSVAGKEASASSEEADSSGQLHYHDNDQDFLDFDDAFEVVTDEEEEVIKLEKKKEESRKKITELPQISRSTYVPRRADGKFVLHKGLLNDQ